MIKNLKVRKETQYYKKTKIKKRQVTNNYKNWNKSYLRLKKC